MAVSGVPVHECIGVDLGGTKLSVGLLRDGELAEHREQPTVLESTDALLEQVMHAISSMRGEQTEAIGLGIPSTVDWATGRARASVNIPLVDVPVRDLLSERLGLPVFVDNDATCAALAEAHHGDGPVPDSMVMFTVGTGVGGGIIIGGRPFRGATGAAAEIGHMVIAADVVADGPPRRGGDHFPKPASLEWLASGRALDRLARRSAQRNRSWELGRRARERVVGGRDVVEAAQAGDPEARRLLAVLGERLGLGIATAVNFLDPEVVAIGGGVSTARELLLDPAREVAQRFILPGVGTSTEIRLARSGPEAGVHGAAMLAAQEVGQSDTAGVRA
ncbi:MAG: sugar kinase [Solirubrobacterales bacterium]|nr:MAG: sugar kinase [Solirubrobacterales bacterium]